MRYVRSLLTCIVCLLSFPADANFFDGNKLENLCSVESGISQTSCAYYVMGITDGIMLQQNVLGNTKFICIPPSATGEQITAVAKKFMHDHPEILHYPANALVNNALVDAFPCQ